MKIEAAANKYPFVWRKAVTRNQQKLAAREPELFREAEQLFGIRVVYGEVIHMYHLRKKLKKLQKQEYLVFVRGSGKHKSSLQKFTERLDETSRRLRQYVKHLHIAGKRAV